MLCCGCNFMAKFQVSGLLHAIYVLNAMHLLHSIYVLHGLHIILHGIYQCCESGSVPVRSGLFGSPGSGSGKIPDPGKYRIRILYPQKDPCNANFLVKYICLKYSFV